MSLLYTQPNATLGHGERGVPDFGGAAKPRVRGEAVMFCHG